MLVTFSEFARLKGIKPPSVHEAAKARIAGAVVEKDGKRWLDQELALELWDRNTKRVRATQVSQEAKDRDARPLPTPDDVRRSVCGLPDDAIPGLDVSRERREHYQAELAKLEVDVKRKDLVPADMVRREAFALARSVRDALFNIADRLSAQLAAENDPAAVHLVITAEVEQALERLCDG